MLLTHELLTNPHVNETTRLAHELLCLHVLCKFEHLVDRHLICTVNISPEEGHVAAMTLVELTDMDGVFEWFLIETISLVVKSGMVVKLIDLELPKSFLAQPFLQDFHFKELLADLGHTVRAGHLLLAFWAPHEVEGDALGTPTMLKHVSDTASMENVAAIELCLRCLTEGAAADTAVVMLGDFVSWATGDLEAGHACFFTLAASAGVPAVELFATELDLVVRLEGRDCGVHLEHDDAAIAFVDLGHCDACVVNADVLYHLVLCKVVCFIVIRVYSDRPFIP